jgi:hypothetical protein
MSAEDESFGQPIKRAVEKRPKSRKRHQERQEKEKVATAA